MYENKINGIFFLPMMNGLSELVWKPFRHIGTMRLVKENKQTN